MSVLTKIFEPIVEEQTPLHAINVVAFDTMGTLVHYGKKDDSRPYIADFEIARLLMDITKNARNLELEEIVVISGNVKEAMRALEISGLKPLYDKPVQDRGEFYARMSREGKNVLVVDDDFMLGMFAEAHVNPQDKFVREYLRQKLYRPALKFNP